MERKDHENEVRGPGKFEGEEPWTPYFWDQSLDGFGETVFDSATEIEIIFFEIDKNDLDIFPELSGSYGVAIWENEQGFVSSRVFDSKDEWEYVLAEIEFDNEEGEPDND